MKKLANTLLTRPLLAMAYAARKHPLIGLVLLGLVVFGVFGGFAVTLKPKQ